MTLGRDGSIGDPKPDNADGAAAEAVQCDLRFDATRRRHIDPQSTCCGVGRLTIGDGDNDDVDAQMMHLLKEPTRPENLVIGVRRDHDETANSRQAQRLETLKPSRSEPDGLVCSGVPVIDD